MEILFWNKGMFILECHIYGESERMDTEYQFCPEYLLWLIFLPGREPCDKYVRVEHAGCRRHV